MRERWKKAAAAGFLAFMGLWLVGSLRALTLDFPPPPVVPAYMGELSASRLPVANNMKQIGLELTPVPLVLDQPDVDKIQVYEKNAQLALATAAFDDDLARIRKAVADDQAVVFNEKNGGIAPERRITVEIGVHPDKFDALVAKLRGTGRLESISVQQRDRTGEFRRLSGQRQALKKYLQSVLKLRDVKAPSIDDALKLEQKIQDIEKELQNLGAQLGDLLGKESYYNIYVTLFEYQPGSGLDSTYTWQKRLFHSWAWAVCWWLGVVFTIGLVGGTYFSARTLWPIGRKPSV
jgi:Domain of unknown function (DUF4349)